MNNCPSCGKPTLTGEARCPDCEPRKIEWPKGTWLQKRTAIAKAAADSRGKQSSKTGSCWHTKNCIISALAVAEKETPMAEYKLVRKVENYEELIVEAESREAALRLYNEGDPETGYALEGWEPVDDSAPSDCGLTAIVERDEKGIFSVVHAVDIDQFVFAEETEPCTE